MEDWGCLDFIIEMPDHIYDDQEGQQLPSDADAENYGGRVVRELKEDDLYRLTPFCTSGTARQNHPFCPVLDAKEQTGRSMFGYRLMCERKMITE